MTPRRTTGPGETEAVAAEFALGLEPGDLVLVRGEVGAGKTTFVRGACRALGVTDQVVSPTFTIGRRYRGSVPVAHLDLYRIGDLDREDPGLLEDYLTSDVVAFVEWPPEGSADLGRASASVLIEHAGGDARDISISASRRK